MQVAPCRGACTRPPKLCSYDHTAKWGPCSRKCGPGVQRRTRLLLNFWNLNKCAAAKRDVRRCNNGPCVPINCRLSPWTAASNCSATCGRGTQVFRRRVVRKARYGGACDDDLEERRRCDGTDCPIDCVLSEWTVKTECNATCGSGYEVWTRSVLSEAVNGGDCSDALEEVRPCLEKPCPKPCEISDWIPAEPCDCRVNIQKWIRLFTGGDCLDDRRKLSKFIPCKCDCNYGTVGGWSSCCNRTQSRVLSAPMFVDGGCRLEKTETRPCNGTCLAECSANTVAGCSMGCPWCLSSSSWSEMYHAATNLFYFRPLDAGLITRPLLGGRGRTRVFAKFKLLRGERVASECTTDIHRVRQIISHNHDPYTICDGRFDTGTTYVVSGACQGGTLFLAPCGVKFAVKQ